MLQGVIIMNPNNHNPPRRNSSSFNRHANNHSNRSNHHNNHQRWSGRYPKEYNREYDNGFGRGECSVSSTSPKEQNYIHGYPKSSQLSPALRNIYTNEASGHPGEHRRLLSISCGGVDRRGGGGHAQSTGGGRHISPPLSLDSLGAVGGPPIQVDFQPRGRHGRDHRVSPIHLSNGVGSMGGQPSSLSMSGVGGPSQQLHSPPSFYRQQQQQQSDEGVKSESPSRKRRRLSRGGLGGNGAGAAVGLALHVDLGPPNNGSPPPQHLQPRRSPRQHHQGPQRQMLQQGSPPLRRQRYRDRNDFAHFPTFIPSPPPVTHPHQSAVIMDINQRTNGDTLELELLANGELPSNGGGPGGPPPRHSASNGGGNGGGGLLHHHHHHHHHHHAAAAAAAAQLFLNDRQAAHAAAAAHAAHAAQQPPIELLHAARARRHQPGQRLPHHARWHQSGPPPPPPPIVTAPAQYSGFLLHFLAMFSNPPLSPFGHQTDLSAAGSEGGVSAAESTENYEALLRLAERLGEAKPRGLGRTEIDQLASYRYDEETHRGDQTSCVVCMCDFEAGQTLRVLPCAHEFHARCIDKWLRSNRTCPICRGNASDYFSNSD